MIPESRFKLVSSGSTVPNRSSNNWIQKNRHWWNMAKPYRRCHYDVKVIIGPADISFELWFEGKKISQDNPIKIEWQATTAPPPNIEDAHDAALNVPAISRSRNFGDATRQSVGVPINSNVNGHRSSYVPNYAPR
jgi:hypothetical protein